MYCEKSCLTPRSRCTALALWATLWVSLLLTGCEYVPPEANGPVPMRAGTNDVEPRSAPNPHPSDAYFALDHVLDIAVEMAPEDWDSLRVQTRTLEDILGGSDCLAQPVAEIYSWFPATVTVDGDTYAEVGVRKKGFLGSLDTEKPALKVRFDKFVDKQLLGDLMERMTLNNSIQDDSMINTCLAYSVFATAGLPTPRCNFATVTVNGKNLGLYVHVEDIKTSLLERSFANAQGNLYEGTISDFRPGFRGTFEKKTNEDIADWSDIDAVIDALQVHSPAGLEALDTLLDRDRFLAFWATEVLVGHYDGYAGNLNNFHLYREPDGPFVFIPWGVDQVFESSDVPWDDIKDSPPAVLAHGAIAHRLYRDNAARAAYADRLRELLDTVWNEEELLQRTDAMAAIVQMNARPEQRAAAARDTDRVRRFIRERRAEILANLEPKPPDWPWPMTEAGDFCWAEDRAFLGGSDVFELHFETTWGSKDSVNPLAEGKIIHYQLNGVEQSLQNAGATAGAASAKEAAQVGLEDALFVNVMSLESDFAVTGLTFWIPMDRVASGASLVIGVDGVGGVSWIVPAGEDNPEDFLPLASGQLELIEADTKLGTPIVVRFHGAVGDGEASVDTAPADVGLIVNEVAAQGEPLDWFEIHNTSDTSINLADFVLADDLTDPSKRIAFPADLTLQPGAYLQIHLDKDGWPGFALGRDEELGIWTVEGILVDQVDWAEGDADAGLSFARVPDSTGNFQTVNQPTPAAPN